MSTTPATGVISSTDLEEQRVRRSKSPDAHSRDARRRTARGRGDELFKILEVGNPYWLQLLVMTKSGRHSKLRGRSRTPEGPFETHARSKLERGSEPYNGSEFAEVFEDVQREFDHILGSCGSRGELRIIIHLIRSHLAGKLVIATSLATASALSYGSAMRAIASMKAQGLIVSRPRTPSGKSVSLHPSEKLLTRWHRFAHRASQILGLEVSTPKGCERVKTARRSTIAAYPTILPPPPVLAVKLGLERGLRVLVHADPTFTALRRLRRQFENILGVSIRSRALSI